MNVSNFVSSSTRDNFANFKAQGKLGLDGATRLDIPTEKAGELFTQLRAQMEEYIALDNLPGGDVDAAPGQVESTAYGDDVSFKACFQGDTKNGTVAGSMQAPSSGSQMITEFTDEGAILVHSIRAGAGKTGTIAAHFNPSGQSYLEFHNVPDGANILS